MLSGHRPIIVRALGSAVAEIKSGFPVDFFDQLSAVCHSHAIHLYRAQHIRMDAVGIPYKLVVNVIGVRIGFVAVTPQVVGPRSVEHRIDLVALKRAPSGPLSNIHFGPTLETDLS